MYLMSPDEKQRDSLPPKQKNEAHTADDNSGEKTTPYHKNSRKIVGTKMDKCRFFTRKSSNIVFEV
eukprot:13680088-Ditylum_brightwellii.AAC.1